MASLYEQMTGTPNYDDILNSNLSREQKAQAIRERGAAYDKSVDKNKWKNIGRATAGSLVSGASFLPVFNIPYAGTGIGGALYDLGQGIAEGDKLPELAKRTGQGFVIGETVGAVPYVGKAASKTKVGQAVGNSAPVKAVGEGISKAGEKFANSKLYDALMTDVTGNWIKGYHGTPYKFKIFDFNKVGSNTDTGMWGDGLYFTKYPEIAEHYANYKGKNGYIKKVNLDFKNPLVIDNKQQVDEINKIIEPQIPSETMEDLINGSKLYSQAFKDYVFKNGYDSVIDNYSGLGRNGEQLVAFLPEQIKSNNLFDYLSNDSVLTKGYRNNKNLIDNKIGSLYNELTRKSRITELKAKRNDWGIAFTKASNNPELAIETLLKEKQGFVPKAFYKNGIGDIDLVWGKGGKKGYGLAHIIDQRIDDGLDGIEFARKLPEIIKNGVIEKNPKQPNIAFVRNDKDSALIKLIWDDKKRKWIVTSFRDKIKP